MSKENSELIELGAIEEGTLVRIVNKTSSAKKYIFKNGEFGEVSFVLIVGAECEFRVGSVAPVIVMDDVNEVDDESVPTISL